MSWYLRLMRERPKTAVAVLFGGGAAVTFVARTLLGPRGLLFPDVLWTGIGAAAIGAFGVKLWSAGDDRLSSTNRRIVRAFSLLPLAFAAFAGWQAAMLLGDMVLPFDEIDAPIVRWTYSSGYRAPGHDHAYLADGTQYERPSFDFSPRPVGPARIFITHFQHLIVSVEPVGGL